MTYSVPSNLDANVREYKSLPCVCLRLALTGFIECSLSDEKRHDLIQKLNHNEEEDEDTEHLVLKPLDGVVAFEEREPDKHRAADREDCFRVDVRWRSPVLLSAAKSDDFELGYEGCCECLVSAICGVSYGRRLAGKIS